MIPAAQTQFLRQLCAADLAELCEQPLSFRANHGLLLELMRWSILTSNKLADARSIHQAETCNGKLRVDFNGNMYKLDIETW